MRPVQSPRAPSGPKQDEDPGLLSPGPSAPPGSRLRDSPWHLWGPTQACLLQIWGLSPSALPLGPRVLCCSLPDSNIRRNDNSGHFFFLDNLFLHPGCLGPCDLVPEGPLWLAPGSPGWVWLINRLHAQLEGCSRILDPPPCSLSGTRLLSPSQMAC